MRVDRVVSKVQNPGMVYQSIYLASLPVSRWMYVVVAPPVLAVSPIHVPGIPVGMHDGVGELE